MASINTVDEKFKTIALSESGISRAEDLLGIENIYTEKGVKYVHHLETLSGRKRLFHKDKDYVVKDDEVIIVDEFTGRLQPGRRWSEVCIRPLKPRKASKFKKKSRTFASITFQNYFRLYKKLSGILGGPSPPKKRAGTSKLKRKMFFNPKRGFFFFFFNPGASVERVLFFFPHCSGGKKKKPNKKSHFADDKKPI